MWFSHGNSDDGRSYGRVLVSRLPPRLLEEYMEFDQVPVWVAEMHLGVLGRRCRDARVAKQLGLLVDAAAGGRAYTHPEVHVGEWAGSSGEARGTHCPSSGILGTWP